MQSKSSFAVAAFPGGFAEVQGATVWDEGDVLKSMDILR